MPQSSSSQPIVDHADFFDINTHIHGSELSVPYVHDIQRVTEIIPSFKVVHPTLNNVSLSVVSSFVHFGTHCVPNHTNSYLMLTWAKTGTFKPKTFLTSASVSQVLSVTKSIKCAHNVPKWKLSIQREIDALNANDTWVLVPFLKGIPLSFLNGCFKVSFYLLMFLTNTKHIW